MAFMGVLSTNPDFSYLLMKNPASGILAKEIRQGTLFGYYSKTIHSIDDGSGLDENEVPGVEYCIYFRDAENDVSYKEYEDQEFEYMNVTRYNSPLFVLDGIFNILSTLTKEETHPQDTLGFYHSVRVNMMECHPKYLDIFKKSFKHFDMVFTPYATKGPNSYNYRVQISTKTRTLKEIINLVALFSMFHAIKCNHLQFLGDDQVEKYMKVLKTLEVPYLIRYVFKIHLLRAPNIFKRFKDALQTSIVDNIQLTFGNAYMERQRVIFEHLKDRPNSILDVGCGEGRYIPYLSKRLLDGATYHAVDTDPQCLEEVGHLVRKKQMENVNTYSSLQVFNEVAVDMTENVDVICTEVIEHLEIKDAEKLLKDIIHVPGIQSLVVTTPNSSFSKYYNEDHQDGDVDRHDDHKWEYSNQEFQQWVETKIRPMLKAWGVYDFKYIHIGDCVNGECPSQGFIVRK